MNPSPLPEILFLAVVLLLTSAGVLLTLIWWAKRHPAGSNGGIPADQQASAEDHAHALASLARLPQYVRRSDDELVNLLTGHRVGPCRCGAEPVGHLRVRWREDDILAIHRADTLARFVRVQQRLGDWFADPMPPSPVLPVDALISGAPNAHRVGVRS